mmetsp:Transcript_14739/g.16448  ORF Transcript_14739/g.16448 Transcript_14739/m.16448 type:complete len:254 (+) Transcript_14739:85-846(+)|eukprot:CAMPEP_0205814988 /NCGR_PEP_ID=MMETSP0205-20121125/20427_1 /ASSEMBLY_ACC=CAM_ASM_000278 /TAXON_ID=36767 /ORGANISM="Euplotes focardii, Strain TN1" /LENGTH=253 /DNA_ID=CAMNT_0053100187 /DNA_START=96 /DNA_END=857 /DNA_ORIENTATION=+
MTKNNEPEMTRPITYPGRKISERPYYEEEKVINKEELNSIPKQVVENMEIEKEVGPSDLEQEQIIPFEDAGLNMNAIPESEIDKAPLLKLEIIEGSNIGQFYQINACGLSSLLGRGRKDGCVLVGSQEYASNIEEPYNDIILEPGENSEIGKRHFLIKYNLETTAYYLRDLGDGNGTFVRLDNPLILKTGYIISFGDSHMFIQIIEDYEKMESKIEIKFLDGPKTDQTFSFESPLLSEEFKNNKTIKIGRMND